MDRRTLPWLAAALATSALVVTGCPSEDNKGGAGTSKPTSAPATTAHPTAATTGTAAEKTGGGGEGKMGTATIHGVVNFTGKAPEMKVPAKRKDAEFCKTKQIKYNAVVVNNGKLKDALVRIENGGAKGDYKAPDKAAEIDQTDCMYEPRIQGVVSGQDIVIKNGDQTLHNVHTFKGTETWFNQAQPKGSDPIKKELEKSEVIKFTCDVHPWMHGFVVVTDHPFFAVSGDDGSFTIKNVPAGKYNLEAWHSHYGLKKATVEVADGKTVEATFSYDGNEPEPAENKDELKGLF